MVKMHNIVVYKLCINTIIDTRTGKAVKKKTRNSYILHKNLFLNNCQKRGVKFVIYAMLRQEQTGVTI